MSRTGIPTDCIGPRLPAFSRASLTLAVVYLIIHLLIPFAGEKTAGIGYSLLYAQDAPPPAAGHAPAKDQIDRWIRELDANVFSVREEASTRLIVAGKPAVDAVAAAVRQGNPEVVVRGVHVLKEIAVALDDDEDQSVREALQKIAQSSLRIAARRAEVALQSINEIRSQRAVDYLEKLGARFGDSNLYSGSQIQGSLPTIEIGPDWIGTDRDLRRLRWLTDVRQVALVGERVSDDWVRQATAMKHLASLVVKRAKVSNDCLDSLKGLNELRFVSLLYTPIDDRAAPWLAEVPNLSSIRLYGTNFTPQGIDKLRETFSKELTNIDYRQGGFLGIRPNRQGEACEISSVQPDTAADRAGMMPGDLVFAFGGNKVADFESLTHWISQYKAGDDVKIEVARGATIRMGSAKAMPGEAFGIEGKETLFGCEVTEVKPDSYAARMGLKVGDTVLSFRSQRVYTVEKLLEAFRADPPVNEGDDIVKYSRGGKSMTLTATLGEWE